MENEDANAPLESRIPTLEDLLFLCRSLNEARAKYLVIGGWAVIQHGFDRTTSDIDLLVDSSFENFEKIRTAMIQVRDVTIPFANLELLLRTKQTYREKDALDRVFLEGKLKQRRI